MFVTLLNEHLILCCFTHNSNFFALNRSRFVVPSSCCTFAQCQANHYRIQLTRFTKHWQTAGEIHSRACIPQSSTNIRLLEEDPIVSIGISLPSSDEIKTSLFAKVGYAFAMSFVHWLIYILKITKDVLKPHTNKNVHAQFFAKPV